MSLWMYPAIVLTMISLAAVIIDLRQRRERIPVHLSATVVVITLGFSVPTFGSVASGSVVDYVDTFGNVSRVVVQPFLITSPHIVTAMTVYFVLLLISANTRLVRNRELPVHPVMIGIGGIWCVGSLGALLNHLPWITPRQVLLLLAIAGCTALRASPRDILRSFAVVNLYFVLANCIFYMILPDRALTECHELSHKCNQAGFQFNGLYSNGNALGLHIALALPFVLLAYRPRRAALFGALMVYMTFLSGSRSALFAAVMTLACLGLRSRTTSLSMASLTLAAGSTIFALLPWPDASYGLRGYIWRVVRETIGQDPVAGAGWIALGPVLSDRGDVTGLSFYSAHNQFLDAAFSSGLLGMALLCAVFTSVSLRFRNSVGIGLILIPVAAEMYLERPWNLWSVDWLSWSLVATLMLFTTLGLEHQSERDLEMIAEDNPDEANQENLIMDHAGR